MTILESEIQRISAAVEQATGFGLEDIRARNRRLPVVRARIILCYEIYKRGVSAQEIGQAIHRDRSSIYYLIDHYWDEFDTSPVFREIALRIEEELRYNLVLNRERNL